MVSEACKPSHTLQYDFQVSLGVCVCVCAHMCAPKCVYVYVGYVHMCAGVQGGHRRAPDTLELEPPPVWVLGTKFGFFA